MWPQKPQRKFSLIYENSRQKFTLTNEFMIGRIAGFESRHLSARHCLIKANTEGLFFLKDLNSKKGTYLNRWRIPADEWVLLSEGAEIMVGGLIFRFLSAEQPL